MTEQIVETDKEKQPACDGAVTDSPIELTSDQVAQFLRKHPDFFLGNDELLLTMKLPHQRGKTISLVEHQITLLREQSVEFRHKLERLTENAKKNEKLFERIRLLVLSLLESNSLEQVVDVVGDHLNHEFGIEFHSLIVCSDKPLKLSLRIEHIDVATRVLGSILTSDTAVCGQVTQEEREFLFQEQAEHVGSAAVVNLSYVHDEPKHLGVLALGSTDKNHFQSSMDTMFINYLGDVLSRILTQWFR